MRPSSKSWAWVSDNDMDTVINHPSSYRTCLPGSHETWYGFAAKCLRCFQCIIVVVVIITCVVIKAHHAESLQVVRLARTSRVTAASAAHLGP